MVARLKRALRSLKSGRLTEMDESWPEALDDLNMEDEREREEMLRMVGLLSVPGPAAGSARSSERGIEHFANIGKRRAASRDPAGVPCMSEAVLGFRSRFIVGGMKVRRPRLKVYARSSPPLDEWIHFGRWAETKRSKGVSQLLRWTYNQRLLEVVAALR